jgi:hypothetical protein
VPGAGAYCRASLLEMEVGGGGGREVGVCEEDFAGRQT